LSWLVNFETLLPSLKADNTSAPSTEPIASRLRLKVHKFERAVHSS
jgi:hypothetical protein